MQRNLWAEDQASTYLDAARRLRAAAQRQPDAAVMRNLEEVAARYEQLGRTIATLSSTSSAA